MTPAGKDYFYSDGIQFSNNVKIQKKKKKLNKNLLKKSKKIKEKNK